jgi:alpha-tubulin suppressor-like RCC1 family protein
VAAGYEHTCGVKESGQLLCWGNNLQQQLGDGTSTDRHEPTVIGYTSDWAAVSCGHAHSCAMKTNSSIYCWGYNGSGQLGLGSTVTFASSPTLVNVPWSWAVLDLGDAHTCSINEALNTAYCWGSNNYGQLGDGSTDDSFDVNPIPHFSSPLIISAGWSHSCVIRLEHTLGCWGLNASGQLGLGTTGGTVDYPEIVGTDNNWDSLSAGGQHTCAVKSSDTLYCWGRNNDGQLGDDSTVSTNAPGQVGTASDWAAVSAGFAHTCGIKRDGRLLCWGSNVSGQLGLAEPAVRKLVPTLVTRVRE